MIEKLYFTLLYSMYLPHGEIRVDYTTLQSTNTKGRVCIKIVPAGKDRPSKNVMGLERSLDTEGTGG